MMLQKITALATVSLSVAYFEQYFNTNILTHITSYEGEI